MKIFNFFLRKQDHSYSSSGTISPNFRTNVQKAIELIGQSDGSLKDNDVLNLFKNNGIEGFDAEEILLFLPIAFVKHLLPNIKWPQHYIVYQNQKYSNKIKYSNTPSYLIISEVASGYFNNRRDSDVIIKIAGRSAEFKSINELLLKSPNRKLEEIKLTSTILIR